jgi:hypothetical protein
MLVVPITYRDPDIPVEPVMYVLSKAISPFRATKGPFGI